MTPTIQTCDPAAALVAEQFAHACDLLKAEDRRHAEKIAELETQAADFEARIRDLTTTATQYKLIASLATGGGLLGLIALLKALVGP